MPKIAQFDAPDLSLRPSETGVEATAAAARRGGAFFNQASGEITSLGHMAGSALTTAGDAAVAYMDHQQISHGAPVAAELQYNLSAAWDKYKKDHPDQNDQSLNGKFNEEVLEPSLQKFQENFTTQKSQQWAQARSDHLRNSFFNITAADMSNRAGAAVMQNAMAESNLRQRTVYNDERHLPGMINPGGIMDQDRDATLNANTGLKEEQRQKYKEYVEGEKRQMVLAAAQGVAQRSNGDPDAVKSFADRWAKYIDPQSEQRLQKTAQGFYRADLAQKRSDQAEQRRQALTSFYKDSNQLEMSTLPDAPGEPEKVPQDYFKNLQVIANKYQGVDPTVDARVSALVHRGEALGRKLDETKSANLSRISRDTQRDLYGQIHLPPDDPGRMRDTTDIDRAYSEGKLTWAARGELIKDFQDARSPEGEKIAQSRTEFFKRFSGVIDGGKGTGPDAGNSVLGAQKIFEATQDAKRREQQLIQEGKDPHSMYDRRSPNFFDVSAYRVSSQEAIKYEADLKKADAERAKNRPSTNLTAPGTTITNTEVINIPPGMSPDEAIRQYGGQRVRLPDGGTATLPKKPQPTVPQSR